jgi:hypothetical protein
MRREDKAQSSAYNPRQISDDDDDASQDLLTFGSEGDLSYDEDGFAKDDDERKPRTTLTRVSVEDLEELIATFNPDARMLMNVYYEATAGVPTDEESVKVFDIFLNGIRTSRFEEETIEITKGSKSVRLPVKPFVDHRIFFERGDKLVVDAFQWVYVDASSCQIREGKRFSETYILKAASRLRCAPPLAREPFYMAPFDGNAFTVFCTDSVSRFILTVDAVPEVLNLLERLKKATIIHHDATVKNIVRIRGTLYLVNYDHAWYGGHNYAGSSEQRPPARIPYHWDLETKKMDRDYSGGWSKVSLENPSFDLDAVTLFADICSRPASPSLYDAYFDALISPRRAKVRFGKTALAFNPTQGEAGPVVFPPFHADAVAWTRQAHTTK